jgi:hypothetical protein
MGFHLSERYRLELHWEKVSYDSDNFCKIEGAYFSGPALKQAVQLNDNDHIMLDFCSQYSLIITNVYVAKLSWAEVAYNDETIILKDALLSYDMDFTKAPTLKNSDYLAIDTSNHELEIHALNLLYRSYIIDKEHKLYNFR